MKKQVTTITLIFVFVFGFFILYFSGPVKQKTTITDQTSQQTNVKQSWETKTDEQASVMVVVTPTDLSPNSKEWKFDIGMNTHSVELNQDMTKITALVDDKGKEYKPTTWSGPVGGHHREGILIFSSIQPLPKYIELKIYGVGNIARNFTWKLK